MNILSHFLFFPLENSCQLERRCRGETNILLWRICFKEKDKSLGETAGNIFLISLAQFKLNIKLLKCVYLFVCWQSVCTSSLLNNGLKTCIFIHVFSSLFPEVKEKQFSIKLSFSLQAIEC